MIGWINQQRKWLAALSVSALAIFLAVQVAPSGSVQLESYAEAEALGFAPEALSTDHSPVRVTAAEDDAILLGAPLPSDPTMAMPSQLTLEQVQATGVICDEIRASVLAGDLSDRSNYMPWLASSCGISGDHNDLQVVDGIFTVFSYPAHDICVWKWVRAVSSQTNGPCGPLTLDTQYEGFSRLMLEEEYSAFGLSAPSAGEAYIILSPSPELVDNNGDGVGDAAYVFRYFAHQPDASAPIQVSVDHLLTCGLGAGGFTGCTPPSVPFTCVWDHATRWCDGLPRPTE